MSDRTLIDGALSPSSRIRLAYTINNDQPVRCTYISDEPLFYIDAPMTDDDESDLLALHEDIFNESDLAKLSPPDEMSARDIFDEQFSAAPASFISLEQTIADLRASRFAATLLDFATDQKIRIETAEQMTPIFYDRTQGIIRLRPQLAPLQQKLLLIRELRRVWQHRQGALIHPLLFHPDHAIVINRVQAADLSVTAVRVAWELRLAGAPELWSHLQANGHHDMARAFAREASLDFRALNNGRAAAAAFETWFLSERCRAFDRTLIQQMLADYQSYIVRAGHEETSRMLTQQIIAALGEMPYGKNYLAAYAATILADPIFTDVRDRSNANFLWFIKFEQSFRATERDLQGEQGSATHQSLPESANRVSDTTAQVIELAPKSAPSASAVVGGNAVVVDLARFRRDTCRD